MRYYLIVFAKTTLNVLTLWGMTRVLGKRQIDYITGMTIDSLATNLVGPEEDWRTGGSRCTEACQQGTAGMKNRGWVRYTR